MKKVNKMNFLLEETSKWLLSLGLIISWYDNAGWEITGLDWATGKTRHQVNLGKSNRGNGAYAILQYFPNGDLLFNSVAGPFRAPLK